MLLKEAEKANLYAKYKNSTDSQWLNNLYLRITTLHEHAVNLIITRNIMIGLGVSLFCLGSLMFICQPWDPYFLRPLKSLEKKQNKLDIGFILNPEYMGGLITIRF